MVLTIGAGAFHCLLVQSAMRVVIVGGPRMHGLRRSARQREVLTSLLPRSKTIRDCDQVVAPALRDHVWPRRMTTS
jgi:hypothetical protein